MSIWHHMSIAPRDGTVILLKFHKEGKPVVAWWEDEPANPLTGEPDCSWWWDDGLTGLCEDGSRPIMWAAIPTRTGYMGYREEKTNAGRM